MLELFLIHSEFHSPHIQVHLTRAVRAYYWEQVNFVTHHDPL